ncbi:putative uncharacterized protein [Pseudomonas sp. StFLB209]|uniref:hypothetical protein n=1 Tax=Pseudomonas sp. StFLB209 TaxID=1028989 RepID=UPI0004F75017|nr:hypothetical protein [Pseudomonas sp. StFLB209]BAP43947.1 putative uncharacterized protein [Pseudomonas sp. StFLB209]
MNIDFAAEEWLGTPTQEEMLRHHCDLIETENDLLRVDLDRYRQNQAKLIDMLSIATAERDKLRVELRQAGTTISSLHLQTSQLDNKLRSTQMMYERYELGVREAEAKRLAQKS